MSRRESVGRTAPRAKDAVRAMDAATRAPNCGCARDGQDGRLEMPWTPGHWLRTQRPQVRVLPGVPDNRIRIGHRAAAQTVRRAYPRTFARISAVNAHS